MNSRWTDISAITPEESKSNRSPILVSSTVRGLLNWIREEGVDKFGLRW